MKKLIIGMFLASLAACATTDDVNDLGASSEAATVESGYFIARQDFRKCASPMCGGFFVRKTNNDAMTCVDGSESAECYVGAVNFSSAGVKAAEVPDLRARLGAGQVIVKANLSNSIAFGSINASEIYEAWTDQAPEGSFHKLSPTGIMCITTPCPTLAQTLLNGDGTSGKLTGLNVDGLNIAEETKDAVQMLAYEGHLLAAGFMAMKPGTGTVFIASQVYARRFPKIVDQFFATFRYRSPAKYGFEFTFAADDTFSVTRQFPCQFERNPCAIKMAPIFGTWNLNYDSTALSVAFTSPGLEGQTAVFVVGGSKASNRTLTGFAFEQELKLKR